MKMFSFWSNRIRSLSNILIRSINAINTVAVSPNFGLICVVTDSLKGTYKAGEVISKAAKIVKGGGGGAPHLATAGGKDVSKLASQHNRSYFF